VPANTPDHISRVLDIGAMGVIAPQVRSAAEARAVVRAAKLPPAGERSNTGLFPQLHYKAYPAAEIAARTTARASAALRTCGAMTPIAPMSRTREI
jgi:2-keto-3-deoxy-L-rhamnonate aldolase RhmA